MARERPCSEMYQKSSSPVRFQPSAYGTWLLLSMYEQGLTGPLAEFAAKKYKSHRAALSKVVIDAVEMQQLQSELAAKLKD